MRWNCPHCSTLVNLDIDLDQSPKAYVRCGKCMGIALIQKKAFADSEALPAERDLAKGFMTARDALQEEQANLQNSQTGIARHYNDTHPADDAQNGEATVEGAMLELNAGGPIREFRAKTSLPKPPAFLLSAAVSTTQSTAPTTLYSTFHVDTEADQSAARIRSLIILAIAAAALVGGIYLFIQGQKAMTESRMKSLKTSEKIGKISLPSEEAVKAETIAGLTNPASASISGSNSVSNSGSNSGSNSVSNSQVIKTSQSTAAPPAAIVGVTTAGTGSGTRPARIRVIVPQAILRSGPSVESAAVDRIGKDEVMTIQSFRGNWIQVEGRKNGWLRNDLVTMTQ